jgi:hypothetical protein
MIRIICFCVVMAASAEAQNTAPSASAPPPLTALEQTVRQKTAEWEKLAQSLDASILGLLPCDPKATVAITAVSKASAARVAAITAYLQEAARQTLLQTSTARRVLAFVQPVGADLSVEKSDLEQEQLGVKGQTVNLTESGRRRPSFNASQDALQQISALEQQRGDAVDSAIGHSDASVGALLDLVAQLEAREGALKETQAGYEAERIRWSAYYAARLARAQSECNASKGLVTTPARPQTKQK